MDILKIVLTSLLSIVELFILTKLMGKRQISELNFFDYICGITIGSIAAEMAINDLNEFWKPAAAMAIYSLVAVIISTITDKCIKSRRILSGTSTILMDNGKIFNKDLSDAKMDLNELLMQCRINGYFNIDDLQTIILEPNGKLSFLPKADIRPLSPKDVNIAPVQEQTFTSLIMDGKVLNDNLKSCGKEIQWLKKELKRQNKNKIEDIFFAAYDNNNNFICFEKQDATMSRDKFS